MIVDSDISNWELYRTCIEKSFDEYQIQLWVDNKEITQSGTPTTSLLVAQTPDLYWIRELTNDLVQFSTQIAELKINLNIKLAS